MKKETKKAPTIRFRGFNEEWEQRKLEDFGRATGGTSIESEFNKEGKYKVISIGSYSENSTYTDQGIRCNLTEKTQNRILNKNDLTMILNDKTAVGRIIGRVLLIEQDNSYVYNQRTERIEPNKNKYDPLFLYEMLNAPGIRSKIVRQCQGNTQIYVNWPVIANQKYKIPELKEQKIIGFFLKDFDHLITLHQRKLDQLKTLKKYFLQNMFPAKGEKVPRIRFKGFTGDWEQRKLEDLASFSKGAGYSKSDLQASGIPIVLYGRLYTKYETVIKDVDTFVDALADSVYSQGGEVIVPASGETAEDISIASVVEKPGIVLGGDLNIIHPSDDLDSTFLAISISNGNPHKEMAKRAQGKSVVHLHNNDLVQIKLLYPSVTEQRKISQYFSGLDTLITLHQHKLDQLQTMKKFMLQNLFI